MAEGASWPPNSDGILRSVQELFAAGPWWVYKGSLVRELERRFAESHECRYGVSVCNGAVALEVVLRALGIGAGDRVVLPAYDYYSLPRSVAKVGALPAFVDVYPDNLTLNVEQARAAVRNGARAVVAVHLSSSVAKLDALAEMCREEGVPLLEDCAQAHGASFDGRRVGSWGAAGLFSFGGVKLMTCGQGGMVITSDPDLYERCYALANRGLGPDGAMNRHGLIGDNYELSELSAAVLMPQMDTLDELAGRREARMRALDEAVARMEGLRPVRQFDRTTCRSHMRYCCFYLPPRLGAPTRDELVAEACRRGVPLGPGHPAVTTDPRFFQAYGAPGRFPAAEAAAEALVGFHHTELLRDDETWSRHLAVLRELLQA